MTQKSRRGNQDAETMMHFLRCKVLLAAYILLLVTVFTGCAASNKSRKEDADIHYRLGIVHYNGGNIPDALKELTAAVEAYHDNAEFHNALGLAYFAKGMNDDAIKHLKEAAKINEKFSDAHTNLSAVYLEKKEWDLAIAEARIALSDIFYATPEFAYFNMGRAFYEKAD
ncbi:MAG: tetratricopeptide repeat protein, partial [Deltaproteobacteria bacterium]